MTKDEYVTKIWNNSIGNTGCFWQTIKICLIALCVMMLASCATKTKIEYVDREVVKYQKELVHDTLIQHTHDSVYHTVFQKGDTVFDTKYVEKTKWRDRVVVKTDTCYRDSIQTVIKESVKEKQIIPKWCYFCLVVCAIFLIFAFRKLIQWLQII